MSISKKLAIFRFEASPTIGAGHAIRSCVLADALIERDWACKVATSLTTYDFVPKLDRFERLDPDGFYQNPLLCDLLVVDNYELDQIYEKHFRRYAKKILVIDDFAKKKHDCDILLNQNFGFIESNYTHLVEQNCRLMLGIEYCLVDKSFYMISKRVKNIKKILFYMGGAGNINLVRDVIIQCSEKYETAISAGFINKTSEHQRSVADMMFQTDKIKDAYAWSDICVGFAGQGMFERYVMGIPSLIFSQNAAQHEVLNKIKCKNIIYCSDIKNISYGLLEGNFLKILENYKYTKQIANLDWIDEI